MAIKKKNPIIGPATKAKITSAVRRVQNSKAAGAVKKAGVAVKQEARVIGRAVTKYGAKKEKQAAAPASPASAFQATSKVFGSGKIKSPSELRMDKKKERAENREFRKAARSADRTKRITDGGRAYTLSPGSERYQSSKGGLTMYKNGVAIPLPKSKRKAVRVISENMNTAATGRARKKLAKQDYETLKSKPTTMVEMRKQNKKKSKKAGSCTTKGGPGVNMCTPGGAGNEGRF